MVRAEVTSKEDKRCCRAFRRRELQGSWCWGGDGPGMTWQLLSRDLWVAKEITPVPLGVCFPIMFPVS